MSDLALYMDENNYNNMIKCYTEQYLEPVIVNDIIVDYLNFLIEKHGGK